MVMIMCKVGVTVAVGAPCKLLIIAAIVEGRGTGRCRYYGKICLMYRTVKFIYPYEVHTRSDSTYPSLRQLATKAASASASLVIRHSEGIRGVAFLLATPFAPLMDLSFTPCPSNRITSS